MKSWLKTLHPKNKDHGIQSYQFSSVQSLSRVQLFTTPWTAGSQASLSMGFSRQEYWSGVPLPSPTQGSYTLLLYQQANSISLCHLDVDTVAIKCQDGPVVGPKDLFSVHSLVTM